MLPRPDRAAARAVSAVASAATNAAGEAADYAGRVVALLDGAERLLARAESLLDRAEAVTLRAEGAVTHVERTTDDAAAQVTRVTDVAAGAARTAERADTLAARAAALLEQGEPLIADALPKVRRFLDDLTDREMAAMIRLIDRTPEILEHVDETVVPTMQRMSEVGPDIKELLATVASLRDLLESVPGMGLVRKRAETDDG